MTPRKWWIAGVSLVAVGVLVALTLFALGRTSLSKTGAKHVITGTMTVHDATTSWKASEPCSGDGGYADIREGASVVVYNGAGAVISKGELGAGMGGEAIIPGGDSILGTDTANCSFTFTIPDVPDSDFYKVEVSHRGGLTFSRSEMKANGWTVSATLG